MRFQWNSFIYIVHDVFDIPIPLSTLADSAFYIPKRFSVLLLFHNIRICPPRKRDHILLKILVIVILIEAIFAVWGIEALSGLPILICHASFFCGLLKFIEREYRTGCQL